MDVRRMETVYHGTTLEAALQIAYDRKLLRTDKQTRRHNSTHCGYVYVTKRLVDAMDFSSRPDKNVTPQLITVFKIEINSDELITDCDEEKWRSTISQDGYKECYKIKRDLLLPQDVKAVYTQQFNSHELLGQFLSNVSYGEKIITENDWDYFFENEDACQTRFKITHKLGYRRGEK